jgi:unspecific monooxygenase
MKTLRQSPLDPGFVQDPYALYARVLRDAPVQFWQDYNMVAVFDAKRVQSLLKDRRLGRAVPADQRQRGPKHLAAFDALEQHSLLELEPPDHTRLRALVLRAFTSRRVQALRPDIEAVCDNLLARLEGGTTDLISSYCREVPVRIIARLLGVPEDMAPQLLGWSNAMVAMYQAGRNRTIEEAANRAATEFADYLGGYIEARRSDPRDDLITHLVRAENEGQTLSRDEMIGTCVLLLNAGHEATVHTLGNGVKALLEAGTSRIALSDAWIAATVEEILRFDPPLHLFTRTAFDDINLGDTVLPRGAQVALILGAAGRDPAVFEGPDRFDPFRAPRPHAAFGAGLHFCLGAPLARLEMQIALQKLFARFPDMQMAGKPRYADSYHFHGLTQLEIALKP